VVTVFTGLVQDVGTVEAITEVVGGDSAAAGGAGLRISTRLGAEIAPGDSVAVEGVCLTAAEADPQGFAAEAMNQTLRLTSLGGLEAGEPVNLELAVRPSERLGGHILQGHVDGIGEVVSVEEDGFARRLRVRLPPDLLRYAVERGSIGLGGVSLTISALGEDWAEVSLIPETLERTTLGEAAEGARLNVEADVIAKYVERLVAYRGEGKEHA
jgi:riboflavin synthase